MNLWFSTEDENGVSHCRLAMLKAALFDMFADHNRTPPVVDYISMVSGTTSLSTVAVWRSNRGMLVAIAEMLYENSC